MDVFDLRDQILLQVEASKLGERVEALYFLQACNNANTPHDFLKKVEFKRKELYCTSRPWRGFSGYGGFLCREAMIMGGSFMLRSAKTPC
jgi:hypothetical protein